MSAPRRALFLDRDGVINIDHGYIGTWERFEFVEGVERAIGAANRAGWAVVVVTNQSGVARGYFSEADVDALHDRMREALLSRGAGIDAIYVCPYLPGAPVPAYDVDSPDRKPNPGMILRAAREMGLDLSRSALVGDKTSDMEAARAAGATGHLFRGGDLWAFVAARIPELAAADSDQNPGLAWSQPT